MGIENVTKICIDCNENKLISEFYINLWNTDGRRKRCISCTKAARKTKIIFPRNRKPVAYDRLRVSSLIQTAVKTGILPKASSFTCHTSLFCGKQAKHYHHPHGYDEEHIYDIVPVCAECHINLHRNPWKLMRRFARHFGRDMYIRLKERPCQ